MRMPATRGVDRPVGSRARVNVDSAWWMRTARVLAVALAAVFLAVAPARAHGIVVRSDPPPNAALPTAPRQVVLEFSEPADPAFTTAEILAADGRRLARGGVLSNNDRRLVVSLDPLPDGVYTVRWRALWPLDGHTTSGLFVFAVGQPTPLPAGGAAGETPPLFRVFIRWGAFLAALLLAGATFFQATVLRPGLARENVPATPAGVNAVRLSLWGVSVFLGVFAILFMAAEFVLQLVALLGGSIREVLSSGLLRGFLTGTKAGWSMLLRTGMAILLILPPSPAGRILRTGGLTCALIFVGLTAPFGGPGALAGTTHLMLVVLAASTYGLLTVMSAVILPKVPDIRHRIPDWPWVAPVAAAILLAGFTLNAHASGEGLLAAGADWLHLMAAAVWIGGLALLLAVLSTTSPQQRPALAGLLVPRFSNLAGISLIVLVVTGLFSMLQQIPTVQAIAGTAYGRMLGIKLALVLPLVALGAANRFILRPRLAGGTAHSSILRRFQHMITGEAALGAGILLIVAALTITPTARTVVQTRAAEAPQLRLVGLAGEMRVMLTVSGEPKASGRQLEATVLDGVSPLTADARVFLRVTALDDELDPIVVRLDHAGNGRYTGEDRTLTLPGFWEIEVVVRRRGQLDVTTAFPLRVRKGSPPPTDENAQRWLERMASAMAATRSWQEAQQITDGAGNVAVSRFDLVQPDRLRYRGGDTEAVIVGARQYVRSDSGPWQQRALTEAFSVEKYLGSYLDGAWSVRFGRRAQCADEPCRVVLWQTPGQTAYVLAGWVGMETHRLHRLLMAGPSHYMTSVLSRFDSDLRIEPPE